MNTAALNLVWSDRLIDGLAAAGVRQVVISPGSRSTPLVLAVNRHPKLNSWHHPDERSAAFFALGLAGYAREPVALIATSGSAPAHWLPAVIEANRSGLPLVLLSADRPPELQACGSNQTVDQIHLFGSQVRGFHDAGAPTEDPLALAHIRRLGIQAVHRSCWPDPGPVHINLPFREPLTPTQWPPAPPPGPKAPVTYNRVSPENNQLQRIARLLNTGKGLIVCGPAPHAANFPQAVTSLALHLGCPLLADPLSGLRFGGHDHSQVISRYDGFLRSEPFKTSEKPDWILRFGATPVSKALLDYLAGSDATLVLCAPRGDWPDPLQQVSEMLRAEPSLFCNALLEMEIPAGSADWLQSFTQVEAAVDRLRVPPEEIPFEDVIINELMAALPEQAILFSGNSLPIRQLDSWSGQGVKDLRILANRGASGIDGNVSTLLGLAAAGQRTVVGLLGDLAFFHDMNGLLLARDLNSGRSRHPVSRDIGTSLCGIIILLNNGGGGIFGMLPQAELETFEQQWLMPTHLDFSHTARLYELEYQRIELQSQFLPVLKTALHTTGITLIEVMLNREKSRMRQIRYFDIIDNYCA